MAFETRVTVFPEIPPRDDGGGGFHQDSFTHMIGLEVHQPGLDRAWVHTLISSRVADDRGSAELTYHSTPIAPTSLDRSLQIVTWQPQAHVRALDQAGNELAVAKLPAPLQPGGHVTVGGERHRVVEESWPGRHPDTGVCHEGLDYQHVTLIPDPEQPHHPTISGEGSGSDDTSARPGDDASLSDALPRSPSEG